MKQVIEDPNALAFSTTYGYDARGNLKTVTQGTQPQRTFSYDLLSRLMSASNPESGTINYSYDASSNLKTKLDARGITTTYNYDVLNRVTSRIYTNDPLNTPGVFYKYDGQLLPAGAPAGFNRGFSTGRLVAATYGSSSSAGNYTGYDKLGRAVSSFQQTDGQNYGFSYGYNLAGMMTSETYPSGRVVQTEYDAAGRLAGVKNQATGLFWAGAAATDATNRIQYSAHGAASITRLGNSKWEHTNFNSRLQPLQIGLGTSATNSSLLQLDYAYNSACQANNNGNVLTQTITIGATVMSQVYCYDALNRLQTASENTGASWSQAYGYDRFGNRWVSASTGYTLSSLTPQSLSAFNAANNRLIASVYDTAGNQTVDAQSRTFTYDAENRQTTFNGGTGRYFYDGDGRRVKKIDGSGTTVFVYHSGGQLIAEYHSDPVPPPAGGGGTSYLTSDHLGSTRVVAKADGTVKARYDYLPFGEELGATIGQRTTGMGYSLADSTKQKFTQKERDSETGLDYFGLRYYSSTQGRFTSADPIMASGRVDLPSSWNRYAYVWNNPLVAVDPNGAEGIVVSGQPADHKNKTHFLVNGLDRAKKLAREYAKNKTGEKVTWFIYNEGGKGGYTNEQINESKAAAAKAGINVQVVSDQKEIVDYVNEKTGGNSRSNDLISNFTYIGHATPGDLDIGYVSGAIWNYSTSAELAIEDFNPNAFSANSVANLVGGCNTAVTPGFPIMESSVAEQFAGIVGGKVLASSTLVYYPGGVVSDQELVRPYNGKIVESKGRGGRKDGGKR